MDQGRVPNIRFIPRRNLEDDDYIKYIYIFSIKVWVYEGKKIEAEYQLSDEDGLGGSPIE